MGSERDQESIWSPPKVILERKFGYMLEKPSMDNYSLIDGIFILSISSDNVCPAVNQQGS